MKVKVSPIIVVAILLGCNPPTETARIMKSSQEIINSIRNNNKEEFLSLIDNEELVEDTGRVFFKFRRINSLFKKHFKNNDPLIEVTGTFNILKQQRVKIPIYENKNDSINSEIHLNLLFGPPDLFSLDKMTGFELITNNADSANYLPYSFFKERGLAN